MAEWLEAYKAKVSAEAFKEIVLSETRANKGAEALVSQGFSSADVLMAKAEFHNCAFVLLERYEPDENALALFPEELMRRNRIVPLFTFEERLYVATATPTDLDTFEYISKLIELSIEPVVAMVSEVERALNRVFLTQEKMTQAMESITARATIQERPSEREKPEDLTDGGTPAVQMVGRILLQGVNLGASDIHLEPYEKRIVLRYRVDGVLREYPAPPLGLYPAITSRIKIAAQLDIAERRLPQDGRTTVLVEGRPFDMRVSVMPNLFGEAIVIRILSSAAVSSDLRNLGFQTDILERWQKIIHKPHGIVLVTGPTGSGKSTTLYSTLRSIATPDKKIITLEDPVEYQMDGILQIAINADIGYTFGVGLRAILRHDPDTILIGEIRDLESAEIAVRAALTGHALFSTLHTNSAPLALTRLIDMGIPTYQVTAALNGILAQRLVRRLCKACKLPADYPKEYLDEMGISRGATLYKAVGCGECNGIGYRGRVGVHEVFELTPEVRALVSRTTDMTDIIELAQKYGYRPLHRSAMLRAEAGDTTLEEVISVTGEEH